MTIEDIGERLEEIRVVAENSKAQIESFVRRKPIQSAGIFFFAGLLFGMMVGLVGSRRD